MKVITYNINGIRAAISKNLIQYLTNSHADIVCFQELKANPEQFDTHEFENQAYHCYWHSALKKGYSGVALLSKTKPDKVVFGFGNEMYDSEGRCIRADFGDTTFCSLYIPSGSSGDERQGFKMEFLEFFYDWTEKLLKERKNIVLSGDFNICQTAIDIHDPVRNATSSGFLPEEREWFARFMQLGLVDAYREMNPDTKKYSWWSYRAGARPKNLGWRIDYHLLSQSLQYNIIAADMDNNAVHSDHCPVIVELK